MITATCAHELHAWPLVVVSKPSMLRMDCPKFLQSTSFRRGCGSSVEGLCARFEVLLLQMVCFAVALAITAVEVDPSSSQMWRQARAPMNWRCRLSTNVSESSCFYCKQKVDALPLRFDDLFFVSNSSCVVLKRYRNYGSCDYVVTCNVVRFLWAPLCQSGGITSRCLERLRGDTRCARMR